MVRKEGYGSLFRGMNVVVVGAGPAHALYFSAYEKSKRFLNAGADRPVNTAAAAICANVAHDSFMNPIEGQGAGRRRGGEGGEGREERRETRGERREKRIEREKRESSRFCCRWS